MSDALTTIDDYLGAAYAVTHALAEGSIDDLAQALAAADIPTADLVAMRDKLQAVQARCVVSRSGRSFLDLAIQIRG